MPRFSPLPSARRAIPWNRSPIRFWSVAVCPAAGAPAHVGACTRSGPGSEKASCTSPGTARSNRPGRRVCLSETPSSREVFGEPRRRLRNMDKAVIDYSGLRIKTHDLVCGRLVAGDAMAAVGDQLLDQLGARGLVLDQHLVRTEQAQLLPHGALERRVLEPPAEHSEEEEVLAFHSPSCAHREVADLGRLVGGVPALHDTV